MDVSVRVYQEIMAERSAQIAKGRTEANDDRRSHWDWIQCLGSVVANRTTTRNMWIKIASVAVAAVESLDRLGAQEHPLCGVKVDK